MDNKKIPYYEEFLTEKINLPKVKQSQLVKKITKSFDVGDLKIYLKGMMFKLDIATRKKLNSYLDDGKFRQVIDYLKKNTENAIESAKLDSLFKIFKKEGSDESDESDEEEDDTENIE